MILIAAGSNLPFCGVDSQQLVLHSFLAIGRFAELVAESPLYESPAWPDTTHPAYVNAVVAIRTELEPAALLAGLHAVESAFGRQRSQRNAPRTLDLDLVAYNDLQMEAPALPHPRFRQRDFVMAPISDIAPHWRPPDSAETAAEILQSLPNRTAKRLN